MKDKVCVITGANGGLGRATALAYAREGANVIMLCRDVKRGAAVQSEIQAVTGSKNAELVVIDLASPPSIRTAAAEIMESHNRIDVLVNNAAVYKNTRAVTKDGLEMMFATNHLGPFLLTSLLLDTLKQTVGARIINVTAPSTTHVNFDDLQSERSFQALNAFGASKMCNLLFTYELARQLEGTSVIANAVHPGLVKSNLMNESFVLMRWFLNLISTTPDKAAAGLVYLASSPEVAGISGRFFKDRKQIESNVYSHDPAVQRQLWDVSAKLVS